MRSWTLAALLVLISPALSLAQGDDPIDPTLVLSETEFTALGCDCFEGSSLATLVAGIRRGDVLIMVDLTGSMSEERSALIENIVELTQRLADRIPDLRMGVASYRDYYEPGTVLEGCGYREVYGSFDDWVYRLHQPLSSDLGMVHESVRNLPLASGGGDLPEAYSRAFWEAVRDPEVGWDIGRRNLIVNFGDSVPHDCSLLDCVGGMATVSTGVDPGRDLIVETSDDLPILEIVDELLDFRTAVLHVDSSGGGEVRVGTSILELWECWASRTGGEAVAINADGTVPSHVNLAALVEDLLSRQEVRCSVVELAAEPGFEDWIVEGELFETDVPLPAQREVPFRICVPPGTPAGIHEFELQLRCGGETLIGQTIRVEVLEGCPGDCGDIVAPELTAGSIGACHESEEEARAAALAATSATDDAGSVALSVSIEGRCPAVVRVTATDACGNSASVEYETWIDGLPPEIAGVPSDAVVDCDAVPEPVVPTVTDDCDDSPVVTLRETRRAGDCPQSYELLREWTAVDACGHAAVVRRRLTVVDEVAPEIEGVPPDARVSCAAVPAPVTPTVTDACDPAPSLSFEERRIDGACPDDYDLERRWEASDACGNLTVVSRTIVVRDEQAPVLHGVPADVTVECDRVPPPAAPTADDDCDPMPVVEFAESRIDGRCPGEYLLIREWTARDRCSNETLERQRVQVVDTTPPVIEASGTDEHCLWPPNHRMVAFDQSDFAPLVSDNCSEPIEWSFAGCISNQADDGLGDGHTEGDCLVSADGRGFSARAERSGTDREARRYTILATATDACGNTSEPAVIGSVTVPHDQREHPGPCRKASR